MGTYPCYRCGRAYTAKRRKENNLCAPCGLEQLNEEIRQLEAKEGPYYERWKKKMEAWNRERKASARSLYPKR